MVRAVPPLLCLTALLSSSCKTGQPKDDSVILIGATPPPAVAENDPPPPHIEPARAQPSLLEEPLQPVRGGSRALPPYRGPEPCRMALTGDSPVARACSQGGQRRALDLMQKFVRRAGAEGFVFVCTDCHADEDDYTRLKPQADAEFRKLLFLARPED
jgi:hypothetical protein